MEEKNMIKEIYNKMNIILEIENKTNKIEAICEKIDKIGKYYLEYVCNRFEQIENKIDSNFYYLNNKIINDFTDGFETFDKITSKAIKNIENKKDNEKEERKYAIENIKNLSDYDRIVLKNLESRISILEEESEKYSTNNM